MFREIGTAWRLMAGMDSNYSQNYVGVILGILACRGGWDCQVCVCMCLCVGSLRAGVCGLCVGAVAGAKEGRGKEGARQWVAGR